MPQACGGRLTETALLRRIEARDTVQTLPELLLAKGSMTGPHRPMPKPSRLRRLLRDLVDFLAASRPQL